MTWLNRYELQEHVALEVALLYTEEYKQPFFVSVGNFPNYDLTSMDRSIRVEVKCETTSMRTGNVCIEYWNTRKNEASGILVTGANLWLHIIPTATGFLAIEYAVAVLKRVVIEQGRRSDNGRNSEIKLIPVDVFTKYARRTFPFETKFASYIMGTSEPPLPPANSPGVAGGNEVDLGLSKIKE